MDTNSVIGLVLCGGQSSRMGTDKGQIRNHNLTWSQLAFEKLNCLHLKTRISINQSQSEAYKMFFSTDLLILDNSASEIKGPLLGILSTHLQYPDKDIVVLACDMIEIQTEIVKTLLVKFNFQSALCFTYNNQPEPLLGIYSSKGLKKIYSLYLEGKLLKFSMMHTLDLMEAQYVALTEFEFTQFKNFNFPQDFQRIGIETIL